MDWTVWEPISSAPVQTGPGVHPASCTVGASSVSRGVQQLGHGIDHLPPSSTEVKEEIELYADFSSGPSWPVIQ